MKIAKEMSGPAKKSKARKIEINLTWCKRCGICAAFCPRDVYEKADSGEPQVAKIERCNVCRMCELYCPEYAVTVTEEA